MQVIVRLTQEDLDKAVEEYIRKHHNAVTFASDPEYHFTESNGVIGESIHDDLFVEVYVEFP